MVLTRVGHIRVNDILVLEVKHLFNHNFVFLKIGILCNKEIIDGPLDISFSVSIFESGKFRIIFCNVFAQSFLLNFCQSVKVDESRFHNVCNRLVLRLFIKITTDDYGNILEIFVEKLDYFECLLHSVIHVLRLCFQMSFTKNELYRCVRSARPSGVGRWSYPFDLFNKSAVHEKLGAILGKLDMVLLQAQKHVFFVKDGRTRNSTRFFNEVVLIPKLGESICYFSIMRQNVDLT